MTLKEFVQLLFNGRQLAQKIVLLTRNR